MEKTHKFFDSLLGRTVTSLTLAFALATGFHTIGQKVPEDQKYDEAKAELYTQAANKIQQTLVVESASAEIATLGKYFNAGDDCVPISNTDKFTIHGNEVGTTHTVKPTDVIACMVDNAVSLSKPLEQKNAEYNASGIKGIDMPNVVISTFLGIALGGMGLSSLIAEATEDKRPKKRGPTGGWTY